jgi:hypothetical protein
MFNSLAGDNQEERYRRKLRHHQEGNKRGQGMVVKKTNHRAADEPRYPVSGTENAIGRGPALYGGSDDGFMYAHAQPPQDAARQHSPEAAQKRQRRKQCRYHGQRDENDEALPVEMPAENKGAKTA